MLTGPIVGLIELKQDSKSIDEETTAPAAAVERQSVLGCLLGLEVEEEVVVEGQGEVVEGLL